ncbi:MAG: ATP-binding cassette domain-containing protein [Bacteroides sp.]|nr:ATP-binding cassette domain-containing protein [Bacteroides sp.]MCM1446875.1 ATP-binding cassette domain-containing protein [Bacteroides sp.]MCM1515317.1 ATP-binding cassette domain-containing protein [Paraprevotella sp.]
MDRITLRNVIPDVFSHMPRPDSDVWRRDLSFCKGVTYLISANSGMGKSSLCHYLTGYRSDYSGTLLFDDTDCKRLNDDKWTEIRKTHISYLFQELRLFPELTALQNVVLKNSLTNHLSISQIEEMFEHMGLADKMHTVCGKMSFGQQQRVAAIRALAQPFDFLLLDEPISHLDNRSAEAMTSMIMKEVRKQEAALIITSIGRHPNIHYATTYKL